MSETASVRPLRIAVVAACPLPLPRGTPIRILRMAEALAERGHDVHVATYHLGSGPVSPGVTMHRIAAIRSYRKLSPGPSVRKLLQVDPALTRLLRRLLRNQTFDVIHAHHYEGVMVAAVARLGTGVPLVYDAHTLLMSELPFYPLGIPAGGKRMLGRWLDGWVPRLAAHTVCVTPTIHDRLIREIGLDAGRVSVVPNGVEIEHFDPARTATPPAQTHHTVIFTGNLAEYQGIDHLLKAFRSVLARVREARLVIATDSPFTPYEALAGELGIRAQIDIVSSPLFDDLPGLLAAADVAVNPRTVCDGMPVKLLNYMAAARPVASFDSSAPGVVHGQTGWLAPSGDDEALADGIVAMLLDPERARRIGASAREYVIRNASWARAAELCEQVYRRLGQSRR